MILPPQPSLPPPPSSSSSCCLALAGITCSGDRVPSISQSESAAQVQILPFPSLSALPAPGGATCTAVLVACRPPQSPFSLLSQPGPVACLSSLLPGLTTGCQAQPWLHGAVILRAQSPSPALGSLARSHDPSFPNPLSLLVSCSPDFLVFLKPPRST